MKCISVKIHFFLKIQQKIICISVKIGPKISFLIYLYHAIKGSPFTEMARFVFGGDPHRLSEANTLFINHGYNTFFNKISGTSLEQWMPRDLDLCRELI